MARPKTEIIGARMAGDDHAVVTFVSEDGPAYSHCRQPCAECPWRKDSPVGAFPAEAYRISAGTAYDMAEHTFACHMAGSDKPATCAGFLLSGADHNLTIRMRLSQDQIDYAQISSPTELYASYREMAEANGVDPSDPALKPCR